MPPWIDAPLCSLSQICVMEAQLRSQAEVSEHQESRVAELQALVQSQEEQLAEVPKYLDRMRQAKEVNRRNARIEHFDP